MNCKSLQIDCQTVLENMAWRSTAKRAKSWSTFSMNGQQLEKVMAFKYLGATLTKDGRATGEIKIRLVIATASMAKLNKIWSSEDVSFSTKIKLYKTIVLSTLDYGCESWTLTADLTKRIQAFEKKCYRHMLGISWKDRMTNEFVQRGIKARAGQQENLLGIVKRRNLHGLATYLATTAWPKQCCREL